MRVLIVLAFVISVFELNSIAIVIRHDREEARYRELAQDTPAVVRFAASGMGTLVAPQWILTAAHVAADMAVRG